ncbi:GNAT family N-acetyltransferase [Myxococcota bacterium]|nr:GNAT family N-acetyltransferase [Myxococcota bacterium]
MNTNKQRLPSSQRLTLRLLSTGDLDAVTAIYRDNRRFFQLIAGINEPPEEYICAEMQEGPLGYEDHKHFFGLFLRESGEMIGVADFVVNYPSAGKGIFGLLLLSEQHQSEGFGTEAVGLVEAWARESGATSEVTVGVEWVNERARRFWRKCGYRPTGESFKTTALGRTHQAEVLLKQL